MNIKVHVTTEEMYEVFDAVANTAVNHGWEKSDLSSLMEDFSALIDAALAAMHIEIIVDDDEEEEENEFDDEDDEVFSETDTDDNVIYSLTPKGEFVARALDVGISFEDACERADILFDDNEGE